VLILYTLFIGTSWLLLSNKINSFKDLLKFKKYYLKFFILILIYFTIVYNLVFKLMDLINLDNYLLTSNFDTNNLPLTIFLILIFFVISFFYLLSSTKIELKSFKEELLNLKNKIVLKLFLFFLLFIFTFLFLMNFFILFVHYLTGFLALFEWYNYIFLLILFVLIEFLRSKFLRIHTPQKHNI
jgi:hypothetical protein